MRFYQEYIEDIQAHLNQEPWKTYYEGVEKLANKLMTCEPPRVDNTIHNWILHQARFFQRATVTLAGFYRLTGDEKFAKRALFFVEDALQWEQWYWPYRRKEYDLTTGEMAFALYVILDWLGEWLPKAKRKKIIEQVEEKILKPYIIGVTATDEEKFWWYDETINNWNTVCNGGVLCLALLLSKENTYADQIVPLALKGLDHYIEHMHQDGSCEEGVGYWAYAMMYLTYALVTYEEFMGKQHDAFNKTALQKTLAFPLDFSPEGVGISFADVNKFHPFGFIYLLAINTNQKERMNEITNRIMDKSDKLQDPPIFDSSYTSRPDEIFYLLYCTEPLGKIESSAAKMTVYPDNGWGIFRMKDMSLAFRSGSSDVNHGVKDLNAIQIVKGKERMIESVSNDNYPLGWLSPGRGLFPESQTITKSGMLVNGTGQLKHGEAVWGYNDNSMWSDATPTCPDYVEKMLRTISMQEDSLILEDEFITQLPAWHEIRFFTYGDFIEEKPGVWKVVKGESTILLAFECEEELYFDACEFPHSIGVRQKAKMLRVLTKEPVEKSCIKTVII